MAYDKVRGLPLLPVTEYFLRAVATVRENKARYAEAEARARRQHPTRPAYFFDPYLYAFANRAAGERDAELTDMAKRPSSDLDSPWKEALERFLAQFLAFFFPDIYGGLDWSRGYESLDKELHQIIHDAEVGGRVADKLFKVWRKDGEETFGC